MAAQANSSSSYVSTDDRNENGTTKVADASIQLQLNKSVEFVLDLEKWDPQIVMKAVGSRVRIGFAPDCGVQFIVSNVQLSS